MADPPAAGTSIPRMELHQVRHFLAVVDEGGFTAAARKLYIAQPSLSQSVRRLEADLGVRLFERAGRGSRLTPAGERFLPAARMLLAGADGVLALAGEVRAVRAGRLRVAALGTLATDPLAGLLRNLNERHPGVQLRVVSPEGPEALVRAVRQGRVDLGLTDLSTVPSGLVSRPVGEQEVVLALPADRAAAVDDPVPLDLIGGLEFVSVSTGAGDSLVHGHSIRGRRMHVVVETATWAGVIALVRAGVGATFISRPMAERFFPSSQLRSVTPRIVREIGFVHRDAGLSTAASVLLGLVPGRAGEVGDAREAQQNARQR